MEIIAILFIVLAVWLALKMMAFFLDVAIFAIALPFKILAVLLGLFLGVFLLIPLGVLTGVAALLIAPLALAAAALPLILIAVGIYLIIKNS